MNSESENSKAKLFFGALAVTALVINSSFWSSSQISTIHSPPARTSRAPAFTPQSQPSTSPAREPRRDTESATRTIAPTPSPVEDPAAVARRTAQRIAEERAQFLARYLQPGHQRKSGAHMVALVVSSEQRKPERIVSGALSRRFATNRVELVDTFFKPEFVADGLLDELCSDPNRLITKLELGTALDALILARQGVEYTTNPNLENVQTASMTLEVMALSLTANRDSHTWKFAASGAGFNPQAARQMAEERMLRQIDAHTNLTLNQILTIKSSQ